MFISYLNHVHKRQLSYYIFLSITIVTSFLLYSFRFYPLLSSDDAIYVLMTYYYKLPHDIYYWGQDRGGTLTPFVSQLFFRVFGFSAVNSLSISAYIVLIAGYFGFSSLFKNNYTKAIFAIVWFLPPASFIELPRYTVGVQYSLLGLIILFINKVDFQRRKTSSNHLILLLIVFLSLISIWVSDFTIVSISIILMTLVCFHLIKTKRLQINKSILLFTSIGAIFSFLIILYLKGFATNISTGYIKFNDLDTFLNGLGILQARFIKTFTFQNDTTLFSLYAWLVFIATGILTTSVLRKNVQTPTSSQNWLFVFILEFIITFIVILLSNWVYVNNMGPWYFLGSYISFSMIILLLFDNLKSGIRLNWIAPSLIALTVFIGAISSVHYLKYVRPKTLRSKLAVRSEFLSLGEIGVIGEYWNSYITACPDPSKIKATPHEKSTIRNPELIDEVFAQPNIYVIRDMWLESFPDTLKQYGYVLVKEGNPFNIGDCIINRYVIMK